MESEGWELNGVVMEAAVVSIVSSGRSVCVLHQCVHSILRLTTGSVGCVRHSIDPHSPLHLSPPFTLSLSLTQYGCGCYVNFGPDYSRTLLLK